MIFAQPEAKHAGKAMIAEVDFLVGVDLLLQRVRKFLLHFSSFSIKLVNIQLAQIHGEQKILKSFVH